MLHLQYAIYALLPYKAKIVLFLKYSRRVIIRFSREISENFGEFRNSGNSGKCRKGFSREIPGNFPPDFPAFSGIETHGTALILSF
mgnify:CR=1 FL=1